MQPTFTDMVPPVPTRNGGFRGISQRSLLIGGGLLVAIIAGFILLMLTNNASLKDPLQRLTVRLETLQKITSDSQGALTNPDLQKINSDTSILATGSLSELAKPMDAAGRGSISDDNRALEADTATLEALANAQLEGRYDEVYARAVEQKIDTILALLSEIYNKTNNRQLKAALNTPYNNFMSIKKDFDSLSNQ
ncbi:MAG TPA: hypothetical protein VD907_05500 [Verrucomicrobiae bacterium]|nr:hypothetical protein [Verrucomicrobiae bacterium]